MKIVYLVAAHYKPTAFASLLEALDGSPVVAHIDAKADIEPFAAEAARHRDVSFTNNRVDVKWGGWSQVEATLTMMSEAEPLLQDEDYLAFISGDTYPTQQQEAIRSFLRERQGAEFINSVPMPSPELSKPITRLSRYHLEHARYGIRSIPGRAVNALKIPRNYRRVLAGRQPYTGSNWWALTAAATRWLLAQLPRDAAFVNFCRHSGNPDEFFFQTLIGNSPFADNVRKSLMFSDWSRPKGPKPAIIDAAHVNWLEAQRLVIHQPQHGLRPILFVRKVTEPDVAELIRHRLWPLTVAPS